MKRLILLSIAGLWALTSCNNFQDPVHGDIPFLPFEGLNGNVKEVTTSIYDAHMHRGELIQDEKPHTILKKEYDKNGLLIKFEFESLSEGYECVSTTWYEYKGGKLVRKKDEFTHGGQTRTSIHRVIDDTLNKVVYESESEGENSTSEDVYNGLTLTMYHDGEIFKTITYNDKGYEVGTSMYNMGAPRTIISYTLNEKGDIVLESSQDLTYDDEPTVHTYEYTGFDEKGNWTSRVKEWKYLYDIEVREIQYR